VNVQHNANDAFSAEVRSRFGVLPNFFCTAASAPGLIQHLWGFAKAGYLDNPLPSLFKERLFVHLSRFCEIRYCIVRHVGFLVGEGRPAGDAWAQPQTIDEVIALLSRPIPDAEGLNGSLAFLENVARPVAIPEPGAELEGALFDALTIMFIDPRGAERARLAVTHAMTESTFEILTAFLAFIRTAHYWTETHPTLGYEADMVAMMRDHPALERLMLDTSDAEWAHSRRALRRALDDLRVTSGALRSSEDRFRALVMATSDMLYRMSPDWVEMRALDGRGFLSDTSTPDSSWLQRYIPEDERGRVTAMIQAAMAAKGVFELEHRVIRDDGALGWVWSRALPILSDNGEIIEWLGAARNLTARKNAEDALRADDRRKDQFLATLAHELRNPLAPLRSGLETLQRTAADSEAFGRTVQIMDRQLNMLVHLVDDLLDVSRITSGKIHLRRARVSLQSVLAASAEASRTIIDARTHRLVMDACADELIIDGDFDRLIQIFSNLLSNAAKYTDKAGTIEVKLRREGDRAVVAISDNGIGIPAEDLSTIFGLFAQVRSHHGHADGGLGIGLSLVQQLVEMHGGSVHAASSGASHGSTFTVRLPLTPRGVS
jgi:signal transduction histidine kinase